MKIQYFNDKMHKSTLGVVLIMTERVIIYEKYNFRNQRQREGTYTLTLLQYGGKFE